MRKPLLLAIVAVLAIGIASPKMSQADPVVTNPLLVGYLSFDSGVEPGLNTVDLYNLTGGIISPDGIADPEAFSGMLTVDVAGVGDGSFTYSGVDISGDNATIASFLPSEDILSATLSLTLSNSTGVNIFDDNGNPGVVNLGSVLDTPLTNGGSPLTACDGSGNPCSAGYVVVNAEPAASSVTPEPSTLWLFGSGLAGILASRRR